MLIGCGNVFFRHSLRWIHSDELIFFQEFLGHLYEVVVDLLAHAEAFGVVSFDAVFVLFEFTSWRRATSCSWVAC